MDSQRLVLVFSLLLILMFIWQAWEKETQPASATIASAPETSAPSSTMPVAPTARTPSAVSSTTPPPSAALATGKRIHVTTDVFDAVIDTQGGDLRELRLPKYSVSVDKPDTPLTLLTDHGADFYVVQSGLIGLEGKLPNHTTVFETAATRFALKDGEAELRVPLQWRGPDGVRYTKTYIFRRNEYVVDVAFDVSNRGTREWRGYFYGRFVRDHVEHRSWLSLPTFTGGAIYTPEEKYQKVPFDKMTEKPLKLEAKGGWVAMLQHYFVGAWLPPASARQEFFTDVLQPNRYVIGVKNLDPTVIAPGAGGQLIERLYLGPKAHDRLAKLPPGMDLTVDYGWLTVIAAPLFWLLDKIHLFVGNWGWSIIVLTIFIKLAFFPLSAASYKSMAHMKKVQPRMEALKERFGSDRQKLNQALMELYKTEKINPLGGCLPILIQIPVFIALYWVLLESVVLRQAPFMFWIRDLAAPDPFFILPVVMGASMWLQMRLNPAPMDPMQKKIFTFMPIMFTGMFLFFPSGLVLYWVVNNLLSIAQQWQINRTIGAKMS